MDGSPCSGTFSWFVNGAFFWMGPEQISVFFSRGKFLWVDKNVFNGQENAYGIFLRNEPSQEESINLVLEFRVAVGSMNLKAN